MLSPIVNHAEGAQGQPSEASNDIAILPPALLDDAMTSAELKASVTLLAGHSAETGHGSRRGRRILDGPPELHCY